MKVELINTGSELLLGRVLNTNQQWLCQRLADLGCDVSRQVAVPDTGAEIQQAVKECLSRADLVITTGGLGPTSDDITRDLIAEMLGCPLKEDPAIVQKIQSYFDSRQRRMPERVKLQAMVPEGAHVLGNAHGTAPGLAIEVSGNRFRSSTQSSWLVMLPGPPRELRPMFNDHVVPLIRRVMPPETRFVCRTFRVMGLGESLVEERIDASLRPLINQGLILGYCARPGQVDVRLACRQANAEDIVTAAEQVVRAKIERQLYALGEESLEEQIVSTLTARRETLAVAESCTGGGIANLVTGVPGASAVFLAGFVTYSNEAKVRFLGVRPQTLAANGAVSEPVAREMAEGARKETGAVYALSVTGIAGPGGGSAEKPVGLAYVGLAGPFATVVERIHNPFDRETFKQVTANHALDLLRRHLNQV